MPSKVELKVFPDKLIVMKKIKISMFFLFLFNVFSIGLVRASEEIDVQYFFDDRYNHYTDSERISTKVNHRIYYKHSDVLKEALLDFNKSNQKITYLVCNSSVETLYIIKLEPNFFYNPLMEIMYADLSYYLYENPTKQIDRGTLSIKKQLYLQARHDIQLKNIYLEFLDKLSGIMPKNNPEQKINGSFCSLL